jgi:predicted Zn-dependent protease
VLQALAQHFRDDPQTKSLLRGRAVEDADGSGRGAALQALAEHFRDDPQTKTLLRARAVEDADGRRREPALQALARHFHDDPQTKTLLLAQMLEQPELAVLASRDFDGNLPGCDPREAITLDLLSKAAARLQKTEEEVRELYERLAGEVPLTFS